MLKLMYITNSPEIAKIVEAAGVDRIFVDMEYIGKDARQGGMDTVQCHHTVEDVRAIKSSVSRAEVMVRVNPIHEASAEYSSSREEIDAVIAAGADIIMLPYFKTADEVREFVGLVGGRVRTLPLVETPEAVECIDEILEIAGIDEIFVGLNDLSLGMGKKFMFELLADGTVERLAEKFCRRGLSFGFGGIAALGKGMLPAERVIREHYRLGSECAILSRSFCNTGIITELGEIKSIFDSGLSDIRALEAECLDRIGAGDTEYFARNRSELVQAVEIIARKVRENK